MNACLVIVSYKENIPQTAPNLERESFTHVEFGENRLPGYRAYNACTDGVTNTNTAH